jgi:hypothetical protein
METQQLSHSLSATLVTQHEMRMTILSSGLSGCTLFFHILSSIAQLAEKIIQHKMCVFTFFLHLLSETVLTLRRMERDIVIYVDRSSCKVRVILVRFDAT